MKEFFEGLQFSSFAWQLITPVIFSIADIITGYIQALINKNVESSKMRTGLLHKVLIILVLLLSLVVGYAFNVKYVVSGISIYIIIMEATSILENLNKSGIDIKITDIFKNTNERN